MKIVTYYFKGNLFRIFALFSFLLCSFYAIIFEPITWQAQGDSPSYIELAKQFLGTSVQFTDESHRQPLYSMLISPFIWVFGESLFIYPLMWFQYLMVFMSSLIVYKIFDELQLFKKLPFITSLAYLLNISTIYYGFNILSETFALIIYVSIIYVIIRHAKTNSNKLLILLGILNGLMILTRYNAMGFPLFTLVCLFLIHYHQHRFYKVKNLVVKAFLYVFFVFFVLNFWMLYNYNNRGFYGIMQENNPRVSLLLYQRINKDIIVSTKNKNVLNIFLEAREKLLTKKSLKSADYNPGSFLNYPFFNKMYFFLKGGRDNVGGWALYTAAQEDLINYFKLDKNDPECITKLGKMLEPFNEELHNKTKSNETLLRFSAFFQTFRQTGGVIPIKESLNLNVLPSFVFLLYRLGFISMMLITITISVILLFWKTWGLPRYENYLLLVLILLILYYPVSHFVAITPGDANRFKFPSEPIILGLFVYYIFVGINWLKQKYVIYNKVIQDKRNKIVGIS